MIKPPPKKSPTTEQKNLHAVTTKSYRPKKPKPKVNSKDHKNKPTKVWLRMTILVVIIVMGLLLTIAIWDIRNFQNASAKLFGTDNAWEVLNTIEPKVSSSGRTNILVVGFSVDDPGHNGALLTDSILIISIDKINHTGYMLSVPRDLFVDIPDYGAAKINETYQAGELNHFQEQGFPRGGLGLLQKVVSESFGLEIHYNALINYSAVKDIVDALGGIDVIINSDDPRGIFDPNFPADQGGPLKLPNGTHKIDGQTALRLTRARGSTYGSYGFPYSDFNRTQNQQQVLTAIKNKLNWTLVLDPRKNGKVFDAAGNNVKTNISINELLPIYRLFVSVPNGNLKPTNLRDMDGLNLLSDFTTASGQNALIPSAGAGDFTQIQEAIRKLDKKK